MSVTVARSALTVWVPSTVAADATLGTVAGMANGSPHRRALVSARSVDRGRAERLASEHWDSVLAPGGIRVHRHNGRRRSRGNLVSQTRSRPLTDVLERHLPDGQRDLPSA